MKFVEPIGINRKFGDMGHPSRGTEWCRILSFILERGTVDRVTIQEGGLQTAAFDSLLKHKFVFQGVRHGGICWNFCCSGVEMPEFRQALHDLQACRSYGGAVKIQRFQLIQAGQGGDSSIGNFGFG